MPPDTETEARPWPVSIFTLSRFTVELEPAPTARNRKRPAKALSLLKALIAMGGRGVSWRRLTVLWPEATSKGGRGALEQALMRLRQYLGRQDAVVLEGGALSLNRDVCWVDAWHFQRIANRVLEAACGGAAHPVDPETAASAVFRIYRNQFLSGDDLAPEVACMRDRLQSTFLQIVLVLGDWLEKDAGHLRAARHYLEALRVDCHSEELYRRLIACQQALGQHAEASDSYRRCCMILLKVFGRGPSPQTNASLKSPMPKD